MRGANKSKESFHFVENKNENKNLKPLENLRRLRNLRNLKNDETHKKISEISQFIQFRDVNLDKTIRRFYNLYYEGIQIF